MGITPMKPIYIPKKEVARIFNKSNSTITRWSKEIPDFPKPFLLGPNTVMWDRIEIENMLLAVTAADKRKVKKIGITVKT